MARHSNLGRPDRSGRVTTVSSIRRRTDATPRDVRKRIQKDQLEKICLNGTLRVMRLVSWRGF